MEKTENELIAEFMGFCAIEFTPIDKQPTYKILDLKGNPVYPYYGPYRSEQMQFDRSWDWIMPVWARFRDLILQLNNVNARKQHALHFQAIAGSITHGDLPRAYKRLVNAIKWYNENKQP